MHVLIVYGLPCTGKSSLLKQLEGYYPIAVDRLIKKHVSEPNISDFNMLSEQLMLDIIHEVEVNKNTHLVIEMGCLISQAGVCTLEKYFEENNISFKNILLTAKKEDLLKRIKTRNKEIKEGKSQALEVDGPDYLTRFIEVFDENQPKNAVVINTSTTIMSEMVLDKLNLL